MNSTAPSEFPFSPCLRLLLAAVGGNETAGWIELRTLAPAVRQEFVSVTDPSAAARRLEALRDLGSDVAYGAAVRRRESGRNADVSVANVLWVDVDDADALERLEAFTPQPSIIAASSTRGHAHALWQLLEPLSGPLARRANLRLAHALGGDAAACDAARVLRVPRAFLRLECTAFGLAEIVGQLADPPSKAVRIPEYTGRGSTTIAGLLRVVRDADEGTRNNMLYWASLKASKHVDAGELDPEDVQRALLDAAADAKLSEAEAASTVRSGLDAGRAR